MPKLLASPAAKLKPGHVNAFMSEWTLVDSGLHKGWRRRKGSASVSICAQTAMGRGSREALGGGRGGQAVQPQDLCPIGKIILCHCGRSLNKKKEPGGELITRQLGHFKNKLNINWTAASLAVGAAKECCLHFGASVNCERGLQHIYAYLYSPPTRFDRKMCAAVAGVQWVRGGWQDSCQYFKSLLYIFPTFGATPPH